MYGYYVIINKSSVKKIKTLVVYGAGEAGIKVEREFKNSEYQIKYFIDDNQRLQKQSIDNISILSMDTLNKEIDKEQIDLLVIAMPSIQKERINQIYQELNDKFKKIQILPPLEEILKNNNYKNQLKDISVEDLLARHPKDLDKNTIQSFIKDKVVLVTGAGGSIGSEIVRQCIYFEANQIIAVDNSEYNLYSIEQEQVDNNIVPIMQTVVNKSDIEKTFKKYTPDIVIHAAAYKHVPLCEANISEAILNNIQGTKNIIDISIKYKVDKVVLVSTDKAVNPTNVMGTTKRICELYLQNVDAKGVSISATRFGNVLGSSGSIIPKFKQLISEGKNLTVTHKEITRYFMLIPEACELVLQSGALGKDGEIFILDMGEPVKIIDLAHKMIELNGRGDIKVDITGLRPGEKLYEELLTQGTKSKTKYESITVADKTVYEIDKLNCDIKELVSLKDDDKILDKLKEIVPEFKHNKIGG
jgi:UDP-N-acetyl-D-glucosamine 4,6-dehydratase